MAQPDGSGPRFTQSTAARLPRQFASTYPAIDQRYSRGVCGVKDGTTLIPELVASDIAKRIAVALGRNAILAAGDLSVSTVCFGMVAMSGVMRSWAEHDNAIAAALAAPAVTEVDDRIVVEY